MVGCVDGLKQVGTGVARPQAVDQVDDSDNFFKIAQSASITQT
jgi:hypothetical protein